MGGIGIWQLLIVFAIILLLFGTKKLRSIGGDLGSAIKGFKNAVNEDKEAADSQESAKLNNTEQTKTATNTNVKDKDQA